MTIQTSTNYDASTTVEATTVVESSIVYANATVIETTVEVTPSYVQPVQPPLSTGPVYVGNATTSSVIYGNSTINTVTSYSTIDNGLTPTKSKFLLFSLLHFATSINSISRCLPNPNLGNRHRNGRTRLSNGRHAPRSWWSRFPPLNLTPWSFIRVWRYCLS